MQCPHCHAEIEEGQFCEQCGKPIPKAEPVKEEPQPAAQDSPAVEGALALDPKPVAEPQPITARYSQPPELAVRKSRAKSGAPTFILSHWVKAFESFPISPMEFFNRVVEAINSRQIPSAELSQVQWKEGGLMSAKRLYLRATRREHVIDLCAAPFGTEFFISWWCGEIRVRRLLNLILLALGFFACWFLFGVAGAIGMWLGGFLIGLAAGTFVFLCALTFCIAVPFGALPEQTDDFLLRTALIGPFYERFFRPLTYYRIDTAEMFQSAVHTSILEVLDELSDSKGVRRLTELERKPIYRDIFGRMK